MKMKKTLAFMLLCLVLAGCQEKEQSTQLEKAEEPAATDAQQPPGPAAPSEKEIFQIAANPTPLDKVPNVFAEPLDISMFGGSLRNHKDFSLTMRFVSKVVLFLVWVHCVN